MKKQSTPRFKPLFFFALLLMIFSLTQTDSVLLAQSNNEKEVNQNILFLPLVSSPANSTSSSQDDDPSSNSVDQTGPTIQAAAFSDTGQWSGVIPTSFVPVSAANLPNGKLLLWSSYDRDTFIGVDTTSTYTSIFDPATNSESERLMTETGHDMFCPGTSNLADGRVLVSGGKNSTTTSIYNYADSSWLKAADLNQGRGYHAQTVLPNGDVFTIGGSWSGGNGDKDGEIWSANRGWRFLSGIPVEPIIDGANDPEGIFRDDNHAWLWTASNGKVFHAGPASNMHWLDTSGNGSYSGAGSRGDDTYSIKGTTVMYDEDKILKAGGADNYSANRPANNRAYIIDISNDNASVKRVEDLTQSRTMHNSVVLPNGQVLVVGGLATGSVFTDAGARLTPELWDPTTEQWTNMANMAVPRTYHSLAILLPDGRVMTGGGGLCGGCGVNHSDVEIFSPPYLFRGNSAAVRPVITSAPDSADYGQTITVNTDSSVTDFSLVRLSSVTHSTNNDQRRIPLTPTTVGTNSYNMTLSNNRGVLPPGYYMLFAMNAAGTPSISKAIQIGSAQPVDPPPPTGNAYRYVRLVAESEINGNPWTSMAEFNVLDGSGNAISRASWSITADSEETVGEDGRAINAIDGNPNTFWHTQWLNGSPTPPHQIIVDMGSAQNVSGFRYLPRPGGGNGTIANYTFYVSNDGINWGAPVAQGAFANNASEKTITLSNTSPPAPPVLPPPSGSPTFTHPDKSYDGVSGDTVSHSSALNVAANNSNFAVEYCIQPEQGPTGQWRAVVHKGASNSQRTFAQWLRPNDMRLHYRISTTANGNSGGDSVSVLALNQPTKVTYVRDGNKLKLYLNGVLDSESTLGGTVVSNTGSLYIGDSPWYPGTKGQIGGFALYNQAITPTAGSCSVASSPSPPSPPTGGDTYRYVRLVAESEINGNPWTSMAEFNVLDSNGNAISRTGWSITADSEETVGEDGRATNALDGNPNTFWHTQWLNGSPAPPHQIVVDMGSAQSVGGFRYLPRLGGGNGTIADYAFYVSADGVNWGAPVAQGTFANNASEKTVTVNGTSPPPPPPPPPPSGGSDYRYVRLVAESELNGNPWTSMAEFNVLDSNGNAISRTGWSITADSEETVGEDGRAANALDGNVNTFWHTQWLNGSPTPPHQIVVDMGSAQNVGGFRYLPRPGGGNGTIADYAFYVSTDGVNWGSPVAQGTFANSASEKTVTLP